MNVWAVANQKGGVGKTTSVVTLAGLMAKEGVRVLVVDTDPHASLGYYLGIDSEEVPSSLYDIFMAKDALNRELVLQTVIPTSVVGLDLLPATMSLATLDQVLGHQDGMGLILRKALVCVEHDYDYVLIDCSPVLGVLMVNALAASQHIIVPVQTESLAIKGLTRMLKTMELMGRANGIQYSFSILPTMFDKRVKASPLALKLLEQQYSQHLWSGVIPVDTKFRDSSLQNIPAPQLSPSCRGVKAYDKFLSYIMEKEYRHEKVC